MPCMTLDLIMILCAEAGETGELIIACAGISRLPAAAAALLPGTCNNLCVPVFPAQNAGVSLLAHPAQNRNKFPS